MKRLVAILILIVTLTSFCACSPLQWLANYRQKRQEEIIAQQQETQKIGFARSSGVDTISTHIDRIMTEEELLETELEYSKYCSGIIFDTLTQEEQLVFRALQYAMENSYDVIFIDNRIMENPRDAEQVVRYLSYESPFLAQNVIYGATRTIGYYDYTYRKNHIISIPLRSTCIVVDSFAPEIWKLNQQAMEVAKKIFDQLNTGGSKLELIERLYTYVAKEIEYESGTGETRLRSYLYNAFVTKRTNCDGYSNALALLLCMAEVPNLEKTSTPKEGEGHTWNCFEWEGKWYNCDATGGNWIPAKESDMGPGLMFGFADYLQEEEHDHYIRFPECKEPLYMKPAGEVKDCSSTEFYNTLKEGYAATNKTWSLVITETAEEGKIKAQIQKLANRYREDLYWTDQPLSDGRTAVLVYSEEVF